VSISYAVSSCTSRSVSYNERNSDMHTQTNVVFSCVVDHPGARARARGREVKFEGLGERSRHGGTYGIFKLRVHFGNYRPHGFKLREHIFGRVHLTTHKRRHLDDVWNSINVDGQRLKAPKNYNKKKNFSNIPDLSLVRYARSKSTASPAPFRGRSEKRESAVCVQLEPCRTQSRSIP